MNGWEMLYDVLNFHPLDDAQQICHRFIKYLPTIGRIAHTPAGWKPISAAWEAGHV